MIRVDRTFSLYAKCAVNYKGRAESSLEPGNYLIIRKGDGSLMIHGPKKLRPLNYQPPGAVLIYRGDQLISKRKDEIIIITLLNIINYTEYEDWTNNSIDICMTENDLREQIIKNIDVILHDQIIEVTKEFQTPYGAIDILAVGSTYHVVEIKRGKAGISSCTQLLRYLGYFEEIKQPAIGWIMSPKIVEKARIYLEERGCKWVSVQHSSQS